MEKTSDIDEILDSIQATHGLTRGEARRWLREFIDYSKRSSITHGMPRMLANDGDPDRPLRKKRIDLDNERRQFINDAGYTNVPELEPAKKPEIHIPSGESLFQRALQARSAEKKPYKAKFTKSVRSTPGKGRGGSHKLSEPRGEQARKVFQVLKECGWKHIDARDKLVKRGVFDHYPEERRSASALSAVMSVKKRYGPDVVDNLSAIS